MNRRRIILILIPLLLLSAVGALFLRDALRESLVEPLYRFLFAMRLVYLNIPQGLQWAVLIGVSIFVAFRSLYIHREANRQRFEVPPEARSRMETWARWLELAQEGQYFQLHMARKLGDLTLDVVAHQQAEPLEKVREQARAGETDIPPNILTFLNTRLSRVNFQRFEQVLHRFNLGTVRPLHELGYDPVVEYLESQLELNNEQ